VLKEYPCTSINAQNDMTYLADLASLQSLLKAVCVQSGTTALKLGLSEALNANPYTQNVIDCANSLASSAALQKACTIFNNASA
jgi:hypothetical protein